MAMMVQRQVIRVSRAKAPMLVSRKGPPSGWWDGNKRTELAERPWFAIAGYLLDVLIALLTDLKFSVLFYSPRDREQRLLSTLAFPPFSVLCRRLGWEVDWSATKITSS
ncbi:hypothetical protein CIHG_03324 [Coccidioides immitis H538.4]|uniref:Uncharacterized protein n=2 Tax=Coccidioides immitis TaxID=5501 RepID=A0A0J8RLU5_COCIT|nr:hypothetical protein CIRG_08679 [Coccidioides immitis RMSCC 2394]KMU85797.1 hypothetical protein CIHG_03324 [Coccidioides immitis H538.4]